VSLRKANILTVELDHVLDEHGFRHAATSVGDRLGAHRIGAGVHQADDGSPIWPYHYHHGVEELLYVIAGAPVLRDPTGERTLAPGDLALPVGADRRSHTEGTGPLRHLLDGPARRAVHERLPGFGQGLGARGHPPPIGRRRLLAR
jgi:hypothetical protein